MCSPTQLVQPSDVSMDDVVSLLQLEGIDPVNNITTSLSIPTDVSMRSISSDISMNSPSPVSQNHSDEIHVCHLISLQSSIPLTNMLYRP